MVCWQNSVKNLFQFFARYPLTNAAVFPKMTERVRRPRHGKSVYEKQQEPLPARPGGAGAFQRKASELLEAVTPERIEKIESGKSLPHPDEVLTMAAKYRRPSLCNYYCSNQCPIGQAYVPEIEMKELSAIVLEMLASLNCVNLEKDRLIEITADGKLRGTKSTIHPDSGGIGENFHNGGNPAALGGENAGKRHYRSGCIPGEKAEIT